MRPHVGHVRARPSIQSNAGLPNPAGKIFLTLCIVFGLFFLAMPLSTVGTNFIHVWDQRSKLKLQRLVRQLLMENDLQPDDCLVAFQQFDTNVCARARVRIHVCVYRCTWPAGLPAAGAPVVLQSNRRQRPWSEPPSYLLLPTSYLLLVPHTSYILLAPSYFLHPLAPWNVNQSTLLVMDADGKSCRSTGLLLPYVTIPHSTSPSLRVMAASRTRSTLPS